MSQGIHHRKIGMLALLLCATLGASLIVAQPSSGTRAGAAKAKCKKGKKGTAAAKKRCKRKPKNTAVPFPPQPPRPPAQLAISPTSHNFGFYLLGDPPKTQNFIVSNIGQGLGGVPAESVTNDSMFGPAFFLSASTCNVEMPPFSSCTVTVQFFAPIAAQTWIGSLIVTANPGGTVTAALSGSS